MHYVTVFNAAQDDVPHWNEIAIGIVLILASGALLCMPGRILTRLTAGQNPLYTRSLALVFCLVTLSWTVGSITYFDSDSSYLDAAEQAKRRDCVTVEGRVENFHPMPMAGHDEETFDVAGQHFYYSDYILSPGFNNSASHGGPIRGGLPVRICHREGLILILEIARQSGASS